MSFRLPVDEEPFSKRFFTMIIFLIEFFIEIILPGVVAVCALGAIVLFCGSMFGLTQGSPKETTEVDSANPVKAVDEKTLVKIET